MKSWPFGVLASALFLLLLLFLLAFKVGVIAGLVWVSDKVEWYVIATSVIALCISVFLLLPFAMFRATRKIACFGLLITSHIFALCAWVSAVLITSDHWGVLGVLIGLLLGIVGVVPVGILASLVHADWSNTIGLAVAVLLTLGARVFALWLATQIEPAGEYVSPIDGPPKQRARATDAPDERQALDGQGEFVETVEPEFVEVVDDATMLSGGAPHQGAQVRSDFDETVTASVRRQHPPRLPSLTRIAD